MKKSAKILLSISWFFLGLSYWLHHEFDKPSLEQILFHLQFGTESLNNFDKGVVYSFIKYCIFIPTLLTIIFILFFNKINNLYKIKLLILIAFFIFSIYFILERIGFFIFFNQIQHKNYIDRNYVPTTHLVAPQVKKNLILIYVESFENSYREASLFNKNLISSLDDQTKNWVSFENYAQNYAGNYTMGALVSTQCGIPLRPHTWFNKTYTKKLHRNFIGEKYERFLPKAVCLGDVLKKDGYKNVFLGGAGLGFAGKGKFFKQHGYDVVYGSEEWIAAGETSLHGWGLNDDRLLENAKVQLDQLANSNQPFNLTILTVDTHHPSGFISQTCEKRGVKEFVGLVNCTSELLTDFLQYIEAKGYNKNTNIILVGDHLAMTNPEIGKIKSIPTRTIYNKFYTLKKLQPNRSKMYQFSLFPTILEVLDYQIPDHRLALGLSGFSTTLPSNYEIEDIDPSELAFKLQAPSELMLDLWDESE